MNGHGESDDAKALVARAVSGDRAALEALVRLIQPDIHRLALRFLWHPQDAEDATQEILIRIVTGLASFRGESAFRTWCFRVASNALLTMRARRAEQRAMTLEAFGEDLERGLSDEVPDAAEGIDRELLFEEIRIGCTMAMLLCLERPQRLAYILGEIIGLDHNEGAAAMDIQPAAFRARLSRARRAIEEAMRSHCGLVNAANACRCRRRVEPAMSLGRMDPQHLLFASSLARAREFPDVLRTIRSLEEGRRAAALYRAQADPPAQDMGEWIRGWLDRQGMS